MLLKYFYDAALAHASYMVGCQKTGEAIIIDPGRGIQQYLDAAVDEGLKIVAAADTHIHADYVSAPGSWPISMARSCICLTRGQQNGSIYLLTSILTSC
ncbi:MAG: hypothetical protein R3C56_34190 [Pirellulaceae bacterium]